jgi:hypothetical protein
LFRWGFGRGKPSLLDYGRTSPDALAASGSDPVDAEAIERWRRLGVDLIVVSAPLRLNDQGWRNSSGVLPDVDGDPGIGTIFDGRLTSHFWGR